MHFVPLLAILIGQLLKFAQPICRLFVLSLLLLFVGLKLKLGDYCGHFLEGLLSGCELVVEGGQLLSLGLAQDPVLVPLLFRLVLVLHIPPIFLLQSFMHPQKLLVAFPNSIPPYPNISRSGPEQRIISMHMLQVLQSMPILLYPAQQETILLLGGQKLVLFCDQLALEAVKLLLGLGAVLLEAECVGFCGLLELEVEVEVLELRGKVCADCGVLCVQFFDSGMTDSQFLLQFVNLLYFLCQLVPHVTIITNNRIDGSPLTWQASYTIHNPVQFFLISFQYLHPFPFDLELPPQSLPLNLQFAYPCPQVPNSTLILLRLLFLLLDGEGIVDPIFFFLDAQLVYYRLQLVDTVHCVEFVVRMGGVDLGLGGGLLFG